MKTGLTATLLVCVGAAGIAIGALALDAGGDGDSGDGASAADSADGSGGAQRETGGYGSGGNGSGGNDSGGGGQAQGATLTISDFNFTAVTVSPGATVTVENQDDFPHTVTADDGSFDTGNIDSSGSTTFQAPDTPGTYEITCNIHPQMSGTVTVS